MPKPPKRHSEPCPHEIRPGTAVCLHCRHAERLVARARRKRYMLRSSVAGSVVATLGAAGVLGATVIRARAPHAPQRQASAPQPQPVQPPVRAASASVPQPARPAPSVSEALAQQPPAVRSPLASSIVSSGNVVIAPQAARPVATSRLTPIVPEGRSALPDGIAVTRRDSLVVLDFDTKLARTRMPDKFERFVRATLPAIYGAPADSALAKIPQGGLAKQGDLIDELPSRGMRIAVPNGGTIALYPMTRPGQDGPLVTRYRVLVIKG